MADFRSLIPDAFKVTLGQLDLEIKDGIVQLEGLEDDVRSFVEVELRKLSSIYEEITDSKPAPPVVAPPAPPVAPAPVETPTPAAVPEKA